MTWLLISLLTFLAFGFVAPHPSTWDGQWSLLRSTSAEFFFRIATFQSLKGWGGYLGWLSTLGSAGTYSVNAWLSSFGVTIFGIAVFNLLPMPTLNGGHIVFLLLDRILGEPPESLMTKATYVGFVILLAGWVRLIVADLTWLATP